MVEADLNKENEEEVNFDDPKGFEDDIPEKDLLGDVLKQRPSIEEYEECSMLLFGLPVVGTERVAKLGNVLKKIFDNVNPRNRYKLPVDETGSTKGVCFVEWGEKEDAEHAKSVLDGYKLDKNHTFQAILYSDIKKYEKPDEDWKEPEAASYQDVGDLWSWLQNSRCRDQLAVQFEKNGYPVVSVQQFIKGHEPEVVGDFAERPNWTDSMFAWSPHGSFLATVHAKGAVLWGGPKFDRYQKLAHDGVEYIDFSPNESYLVTYAPAGGQWGDDEDCLRLWDVTTGEMKKGFSLYALTNRVQLQTWPLFKWSHDEKYFACLKPPEKDKLEKEKKVNGVSVYEMETLQLLNNRSIVIENLKSFQWCPTKNIIAFYSEEEGDLPAEFSLLSIPRMEKLRALRVYLVAEASMYWQESGVRLAVHTMRYNKRVPKEGGEYKYIGSCPSHIDIFDMSEKNVSLVHIALTEPFISFGWEPFGDKLCVLTGQSTKTYPMIYRLSTTKHEPQLISKLDPTPQLNRVEWAPAGGWLVVFAALSTGGNIIFIDTNGAEAKRTNVAEHPGCNKGYWDPTGRFFVTVAIAGGRLGADTGYRIYTFQGRELVRKNLERMIQFKWRPRPPLKLSEQKMKEIRKNLKTTSQKFDREDNEEKVKASQEVIDKRRKIMATFDIVRKRNTEMIKSQKALRLSLRNGIDTEEKAVRDEDLVEETITVALSTEKTRTTSVTEEDAEE